MATTALEKLAAKPSTFRQFAAEFATDARRQALHAAHEARMLKGVAEDAIEARMYQAARRIKQRPLMAVAMAFAIGVPIGVLAGWRGARARKTVRG